MRTIALVMALLVLAVASGASFVVKAQEPARAATLEYECRPAAIPTAIDTLVSCTFTARNTGSTPINAARVTFLASSGRLPDAYYFLSAGAKGIADAPVSEGQLDYAIGDLAPGAMNTLSIEVIIRSSEPYAADAVLLGGDAHEYARVAINGAVGADPPRPAVMTLIYEKDAGGQPMATFGISISNRLKQPLDAKLRLYFGENAVLATPDRWQVEQGMATRVISGVAPGEGYNVTVTFAPGPRPCPFVHPAAVLVTADAEAAAIGDGSAALGACGGQGGGEPINAGASLDRGDTRVSSLPPTGEGAPSSSRRASVRFLLYVLAFGGLVVAAGVSVRRSRRRQ